MRERKIVFDRVPQYYNEGMFWGNGRMGGMLYVRDGKLKVAVDNIGLWEMRDSGEDKPGGTFRDFNENPDKFLDGSYFKQAEGEGNFYRTRLPGLTVSLDLPCEPEEFWGELDLNKASSCLRLTGKGGEQTVLSIYLDSNVNVLKIKGNTGILKPMTAGWDLEGEGFRRLKEWGYEKAEKIVRIGMSHVFQPFSENELAVLSMLETERGVYVTLKTEKCNRGCDRERIAGLNEELLCKYFGEEEVFYKAHLASWEEYWSRSDVIVPVPRLQRAYDAELYKIYANEREDGMPVTLMGIWNNDSRMPAWCGDLHNDMNVEACYWPVYKTGHMELGAAYIDYYTDCMPRLTERAYKLFGAEDAIHCPIMMGPEGYGAGGEWCLWNCLLGPELFVAVDFIWYYEFTLDRERLGTKIYPFLEKVVHLYQHIARPGEDGYLHIPFTNSPEVFRDGSMLMGADSTIVISCLHYVLEHMASYGAALNSDVSRWESFHRELAPVVLTDKGFPLFPGEDVFESHRHFCQMFPVFPLGTDIHSPLAERSLDAVIDLGFTEYASWSFPYLAVFASRCGRGNMAAALLEMYCMAFCSGNTFTTNGDSKHSGILRVADTSAGEPADTFTLEAGFIMAAAVVEMFVHRDRSTIYAAYGIPDDWKSCSCRGMTVEGGHKISVTIENYRLKEVIVEANRSEKVAVSLAGPAGEVWLDGNKQEKDGSISLSLRKGQSYRIEIK